MIRRAAIVGLLLAVVVSARASADPISLITYVGVLGDARAQVDLARRSTGTARDTALARATTLLVGVAEVRVGSVVYTALPHGPVLALLRAGDDASLQLASSSLGETLDAVREGTVIGPSADASDARARLDATLASPDFRRVPDWREAALQALLEILVRLFPGLRAPTLTLPDVAPPLVAVATILLVVVFANVRRGLRARIVREAALATVLAAPRPVAADHLRAADEALRAGRLRDALRALFLAGLSGLEEHGGVRVDPALTDREILARAAGSPRADELASLVRLYEPAWYGVREPTRDELDRARDLARRIGA